MEIKCPRYLPDHGHLVGILGISYVLEELVIITGRSSRVARASGLRAIVPGWLHPTVRPTSNQPRATPWENMSQLSPWKGINFINVVMLLPFQGDGHTYLTPRVLPWAKFSLAFQAVNTFIQPHGRFFPKTFKLFSDFFPRQPLFLVSPRAFCWPFVILHSFGFLWYFIKWK